MSKKISIGVAIAYMAIACAITFTLTKIQTYSSFSSMVDSLNRREYTYERLAEVDRLVRENYYGTVDEQRTAFRTAQAFVDSLGDPNTYYMSQLEYEEYLNSQSGRYTGIGVVTERSNDGYILIKDVYPESSAAQAGLAAGDIIVSVDDVRVNADNYPEVAGMISGAAGTKVKLTKRVQGEDIELNIIRHDIDVRTVEYTVLKDNVGYLRISDIRQGTATQLTKALNTLKDNSVESLIIDIRDVFSFSDEYVTTMLQAVLPNGSVGHKVYKDGRKESMGTATTAGITLPVTVIINSNTVGVSEFFALALSELPKARLVGEQTAGDGLARELIKVSDGSAIILTTSSYETVGGKSYHNSVVAPDYEIKSDIPMPKNGLPTIEGDPQLRKAHEVALAAVSRTESVNTK